MLNENISNEMKIRDIPLTTDKNLPLSTYIEEMNTDELRLDHPLQRYAEQWEKEKKSNLVRRVIQGGEFLPLLICTQFSQIVGLYLFNSFSGPAIFPPIIPIHLYLIFFDIHHNCIF